ncbi:MAG: 3',5'-cyclic-AMP phosphodiesterase [Chroococcidiopsidaceae cyanobacterium CP_BM_ER_R8_30]|nr:3',5'-cyclic-AMP phosphodiesterase [Chroococcidiopsidaceae cyanobacterium CP_BM_ER_R8_30]
MNQVSPLLVAQVTDMHLFADKDGELLGIPTTQSFQATIQRLLSLRPQPDLLLLTGDLSQDGTPKSYEHIQNLLSPLSLPTYWLPGNHDCLKTMQQVLNQVPFSPCKAFEQNGWQFILLNSSVPDYVHGYLSEEILDKLDFQLALTNDRSTLVALHHPPLRVNSSWIDASTLQNAEDFFAVLDRHPQVKLVVFGHIHQEFNQQRQDVHYLGTPASSIQFEPQSSNFSLDREEAPGFRLLNLYPDGRWETRIERVAYTHQLNLAATGY